MSIPQLPRECFLYESNLEELIGLRYDGNPFGSISNFQIDGSEYYSFVEEGPIQDSFIVQQTCEPHEQFYITFQMMMCVEALFTDSCYASIKPWSGREAFDVEQQAAAKIAREKADALAAKLAADKAEAMALLPKLTELFPKLEDNTYPESRVVVRLFASDPHLVVSLDISDFEDGNKNFTFTSLSGAKVLELQAAAGKDIDVWAALVSATGVPVYNISVILPDGVISRGSVHAPVNLDQFLAGSSGDGWIEQMLTARANFGMADSHSDMPLDTIGWTKLESFEMGSDFAVALRASDFHSIESLGVEEKSVAALRSSNIAESEVVTAKFKAWDTDGNGTISAAKLVAVLQSVNAKFTPEVCERLLVAADCKAAGLVDYSKFVKWSFGLLLAIPIEAVYRSEAVASQRDCFIEHNFRAIVLGGLHAGVVLLEHSLEEEQG